MVSLTECDDFQVLESQVPLQTYTKPNFVHYSESDIIPQKELREPVLFFPTETTNNLNRALSSLPIDDQRFDRDLPPPPASISNEIASLHERHSLKYSQSQRSVDESHSPSLESRPKFVAPNRQHKGSNLIPVAPQPWSVSRSTSAGRSTQASRSRSAETRAVVRPTERRDGRGRPISSDEDKPQRNTTGAISKTASSYVFEGVRYTRAQDRIARLCVARGPVTKVRVTRGSTTDNLFLFL